jgi:uncharacterized protein YjlB
MSNLNHAKPPRPAPVFAFPRRRPVIVHGPEESLRTHRPPWCQLPSGGYYRIAKEGAQHDRHFHHFNELYLICRGKAKIWIAGVESYVRAGDMVCIPAGDEHDILEIYGDDDFELFWIFEPGPEDGVLGHHHRGPEADAWHPVPSLPVPPDFPR